MKLEFHVDNIRHLLKEQVTAHGIENLLRQEVERLVAKHKKALEADLQKLAVNVIVSNNVEDLGVTLTIQTNEP